MRLPVLREALFLCASRTPSMPVNIVLKRIRDFYTVYSIDELFDDIILTANSGSHTTTTVECLYRTIADTYDESFNRPVYIHYTNSNDDIVRYEIEKWVCNGLRFEIHARNEKFTRVCGCERYIR